MNKFIGFFAAFLVFGLVQAHDFGVSANLDAEDIVSSVNAEIYVGDSEVFRPVVGLTFDNQPFSVDASAGLMYRVYDLDGANVYGISRVSISVFEDQRTVLGTPYGNFGVMLLPDMQESGVVSFEAGVAPVFQEGIFSEWPDTYVRVGLVF